jgi:tetratricopeptide (TPR) repeat protein
MNSAIEQGLARAVTLYNGGRRPEAQALCDTLLRAAPGHPAVHQLLAVLCLDSGEPLQATRHIERSLHARPGHAPSEKIGAQAWFAQSLAVHETRAPEAEEAALRRALALWPEHVEACVNLGILLQASGRLAEAMPWYARAYRLREDTFGRIANALCSEPTGALWLDLEALRASLCDGL